MGSSLSSQLLFSCKRLRHFVSEDLWTIVFAAENLKFVLSVQSTVLQTLVYEKTCSGVQSVHSMCTVCVCCDLRRMIHPFLQAALSTLYEPSASELPEGSL